MLCVATCVATLHFCYSIVLNLILIMIQYTTIKLVCYMFPNIPTCTSMYVASQILCRAMLRVSEPESVFVPHPVLWNWVLQQPSLKPVGSKWVSIPCINYKPAIQNSGQI